ncbi:nucleotidyltransferase domain-containing protein [Ohtaekwangia koreensis]|uniref:Nucleotidyltransferase n=1 Tax=Ohtaekwangia koreensis TaxID=688867 RepID=A0A1T5JED1_9BACT|nr:nucleotidyltransferase domain-containing protein [Ohtaekwangia koreensis]SKC49780.1 hypothetical protein SAMN05660236_1026 [Ohtaekwangia koreensis]
MKSIILQKLDELKRIHQIKILFACESGSRGWGFASTDSDYDVRFIYVHFQDFYLGIDEQRDVIELPINDLLDINGWELRKALRLFRKSNGPLYEWLQSPIIYRADDIFLSSIRLLFPEYFSPRALMHHYLSMTKTVFDTELSGAEIRLKKYFYALRPILACRWIADKKEVPPMEFGTLRKYLDGDLTSIVDDLLKQKEQVDEKFTIKPIEELHQFIRDQIAYCENLVPDKVPPIGKSDSLNRLFRNYIQ